MTMTPQEAAHCARLPERYRARFTERTLRMSEMERKKQTIALSVIEATEAQKEGVDHPRLLTDERKEKLHREAVTRVYAAEAAFYPKLPEIIVTVPPTEERRDYKESRRGRFGAVLQE